MRCPASPRSSAATSPTNRAGVLLAGIRSLGDLAVPAVIGIAWTIGGPAVAFGVAVVAMLASLHSVVALHLAR